MTTVWFIVTSAVLGYPAIYLLALLVFRAHYKAKLEYQQTLFNGLDDNPGGEADHGEQNEGTNRAD